MIKFEKLLEGKTVAPWEETQIWTSNSMQRSEPKNDLPGPQAAQVGTSSGRSEHPPPLGFWFGWVHPVGALQDRNLYPQGHSYSGGKKKKKKGDMCLCLL